MQRPNERYNYRLTTSKHSNSYQSLTPTSLARLSKTTTSKMGESLHHNKNLFKYQTKPKKYQATKMINKKGNDACFPSKRKGDIKKYYNKPLRYIYFTEMYP